MDEDLAILADEESVSIRAGIHRLDHLHQRIQREVTARHAGKLAIDGNGNGGGDDEAAGRCIIIGFGQDGLAGFHRIQIPRAFARIITLRQWCFREGGEAAGVGIAEIGRHELGGENVVFQKPQLGLVIR
ncbi:hypothetical protein D3C71_611330 [compost metagenome]